MTSTNFSSNHLLGLKNNFYHIHLNDENEISYLKKGGKI